LGRHEIAGCPQAVDRALIRQGREHRNRPPPVGDLDRLAGLNRPQQLTGPLTQFPNVSHVSGRLERFVAGVSEFGWRG